MSRHGTFVGKGYDCGGLFCLSLLDDVCNKVVNNINVLDESIYGIHDFVTLILAV